jgi:hypothetical protein
MSRFSFRRAQVREVPNLGNVKAYVQQSIVPAHDGRKCVDGRYYPNQGTGMIARPGGDCGYVMALLAASERKGLHLPPEHCFNIIYKIVSKNNGFSMHTDHACDPDEKTHRGLIGCGHLAKAATKKLSKDYDVKSDDIKRIVLYARNIHEITQNLQMINLNGEHQERGVLVIKSEEYSILADNPTLNQMYFIYDEQRDNAFLKKLVSEIGLAEITYEDLKRESDIQLQATLQNLAAGLPIFEVRFENKEPQITFIDYVRSKPKLRVRGLRSKVLQKLHITN